jgi:hypothetical protein
MHLRSECYQLQGDYLVPVASRIPGRNTLLQQSTHVEEQLKKLTKIHGSPL